MGRKSSSKKQKRHEKDALSEQKNGSSRGWVSEWTAMHFSWTRERWLAVGMIVVAIIALTWAATASWKYLTQPKQISLLVPKDTIAIAEIDTDFQDAQWEMYNNLTSKGDDVMASTGIPDVADLISSLNAALQIDFTEDVYPWLARRASVALLADFKPALFLEVKDQKQALAYFQNRRLEGTSEAFQQKKYRGTTMYQYAASTPFSMFSRGGYLIIASDEDSARHIIDASRDKSASLYSQYAYQRVRSAFSGEHLAFAYGKPGYLNLLMSNEAPVSSEASSSSSWQQLMQTVGRSFADILAGEGISVKTLNGKLLIEHLALFNDVTRTEKKFLKLPQKYQAQFAEFFSPDTEFFAGGENMPLVFQKFATLLATQEASAQAIETSAKNQITEFFGGKISSEEFEMLTKGEYAMGLDRGAIKIIVRLSGSEQEKERLLKKLMYALQWKTVNTQLASRVISDMGIITSSQESLDEAIAQWTSPEKLNFKTSQAYQQIIEPQMHAADDIIFAKPYSMQMLIPASFAWLKGISAVSVTSTAFEDGMKTTIFVLPNTNGS